VIIVRGASGTAIIRITKDRTLDQLRYRVLNSTVNGTIRRDTESHFDTDLKAFFQAIAAITGPPAIISELDLLN
jgi:hypothetical protein